jgi:two-component system OmpR family response regulator
MPNGARVTRVLVVEDDPDIREVLVEALRDDGYRVDWAADGIHGLEKARQGRPALVILDLMLPGLDGRQFIRECKADQGCAGTKFIVISAFNVNKLADVDAEAVLQKPFNLADFVDKVAELAPLQVC